MTTWQPPKREPPKTKAELREMLAEAVRNTQAENKRLRHASCKVCGAILESWLDNTHVSTFELIKRPDGKPV
jgi:hypothetical protein